MSFQKVVGLAGCGHCFVCLSLPLQNKQLHGMWETFQCWYRMVAVALDCSLNWCGVTETLCLLPAFHVHRTKEDGGSEVVKDIRRIGNQCCSHKCNQPTSTICFFSQTRFKIDRKINFNISFNPIYYVNIENALMQKIASFLVSSPYITYLVVKELLNLELSCLSSHRCWVTTVLDSKEHGRPRSPDGVKAGQGTLVHLMENQRQKCVLAQYSWEL